MTTCGKAAYHSKKDALTVLNRIMRERRRNRPAGLHVYWCEQCLAHHLGHDKKSRPMKRPKLIYGKKERRIRTFIYRLGDREEELPTYGL